MKLKLATTALTIIALTACGGDDSLPNGEPSTAPSESPTPTSTPSPTNSPSASPTPQASPSPVPTSTPTPTASPTPSPSPTPSLTPTPIPSDLPTAIPVPTEPYFERGTLGNNDKVPEINCDSVAETIDGLTDAISKEMPAGTTLCLKNGTYSGEFVLEFGGIGTEQQPIKVAAETSGGVTITGDVQINMSGEYVQLQGFIFKDGNSASSDVLQTRNGSVPCNYCRITEVAMINLDQNADASGRWLKIYGQYNRVDHSWFVGKTTRATLLEVVRDLEDGVAPTDTEKDFAQIDHNYFGNRPPAKGQAYPNAKNDNEYEAIRIGTSDTHAGDSYSVVEFNVFERIQGEAEVISNKSGHNRISHNTVRNSYGSITTRHGSSATIANNFIIGDDYPYAGGLRLVDDGHTVINNYIEGARYQNTSHHGGIVLMGSDGGSSSGYQQFENVLIAHNTIVNSVNSLNVDGGKKSTNPKQAYLANNIIANAIGPVIVQAHDGLPADSIIAGNIIYGQGFSDSDALTSADGFIELNAELKRDTIGIYRPREGGPDLTAAANVDQGAFADITQDFDGQMRSDITLAGADHASTDAASTGLLNAYDVGPINYRPPVTDAHVMEVELANHDFDRGTEAWTITGASISYDNTETFSRGASAKLTTTNDSLMQEITLQPNTHYMLSAFAKGPLALGVTIAGETSQTEAIHSGYRFVSHAFHSGDSTSASIFGKMDNFVKVEAVKDWNFADYRANSGSSTVWVASEGENIGDVGSSKDSASSPAGSVKLGYRYLSHENGSPSIAQKLEGILVNTEYTLSFYLAVKSGSQATVTAEVKGNGEALTSNIVNYAQLDKASEKLKGFRKFTTSFNSGNNTELELSIRFNPQAILGDKSVDAKGELSKDTKKKNELRIDEVSLSFEGEPAADSEVFFDSFRVVSYPGSPE